GVPMRPPNRVCSRSNSSITNQERCLSYAFSRQVATQNLLETARTFVVLRTSGALQDFPTMKRLRARNEPGPGFLNAPEIPSHKNGFGTPPNGRARQITLFMNSM